MENYVLVNEFGAYVSDVDDRGYISVTPYLEQAIKYLSYESATEDSDITGCEIVEYSKCKKKLALTELLNSN